MRCIFGEQIIVTRICPEYFLLIIYKVSATQSDSLTMVHFSHNGEINEALMTENDHECAICSCKKNKNGSDILSHILRISHHTPKIEFFDVTVQMPGL